MSLCKRDRAVLGAIEFVFDASIITCAVQPLASALYQAGIRQDTMTDALEQRTSRRNPEPTVWSSRRGRAASITVTLRSAAGTASARPWRQGSPSRRGLA